MLNEQILDELLPKFSLSLIQDYKYKKLEIDKKLDEIVNKKIGLFILNEPCTST